MLIKDVLIEYFQSCVWLRQGYPLSPYLFILYANTLSHALRATIHGLELKPTGLAPKTSHSHTSFL